MKYLWSFLIGGALCGISQILIDKTKLTPARILVGNVVAGAVLSAVGVYGPLVDFAGCGATVPLSGFGHLLIEGVEKAIDRDGSVGILTGGITGAAGGITAVMIFSLIAAIVFKGNRNK